MSGMDKSSRPGTPIGSRPAPSAQVPEDLELDAETSLPVEQAPDDLLRRTDLGRDL